MKKVFDENYKAKFAAAGLLKKTNGELSHFLSDVATMHVVRWSDGGWGMCSHNYDGDVLTDEIAQVRGEEEEEGENISIPILYPPIFPCLSTHPPPCVHLCVYVDIVCICVYV
jgi:hypothetical protein